MQVLYVYKDYFPVLGGIEGHVKLLAEGMAARGVDVRVLVTNTARRTVTEHINGVPVTKTSRLANISSAPVSADLFRLIGAARPDISHLHFPYPIGELAQLLRGRARRLVVTYHSDIVRQRWLRIFYRPFLQRLLVRADAISLSNPTYITNSHFVAPHASKCVIIHHGQDISRFAPTAKSGRRAAEIRSEHGTPLVIFVGRMRYYKGGDVLIAAMREVARPAHALFVGSGPMEAAWKSRASAPDLKDRIHFAGNVSDADLPAYYQAASVFVLPSTLPAETWGAVQIEAMASGLPSICTDLGTGTSYVNQDGITGLMVAPGDPHALAAAINRLLADESLRRRLGEAARCRAEAEFSHTHMLDQTLALYQRLLGT
jgi:glycosyltransferase involved in cell wall biosynthesis